MSAAPQLDAIDAAAAALGRVIADLSERSAWPDVPVALRARVLAELERASGRLANLALVLGRHRPKRPPVRETCR